MLAARIDARPSADHACMAPPTMRACLQMHWQLGGRASMGTCLEPSARRPTGTSRCTRYALGAAGASPSPLPPCTLSPHVHHTHTHTHTIFHTYMAIFLSQGYQQACKMYTPATPAYTPANRMTKEMVGKVRHSFEGQSADVHGHGARGA